METSGSTEMAAEIVAAFVSNNSVPRSELSALFETVHAAVKSLAEKGVVAQAVTEPPAREPAVSIRKSVTPDYLICLDDGRKFKSLRRHLGALGMTPEQYRAKWNLPYDYPMVASNYTAQRSELAKKIGLGQLRRTSPHASFQMKRRHIGANSRHAWGISFRSRRRTDIQVQ